jgi:hypothetical protein
VSGEDDERPVEDPPTALADLVAALRERGVEFEPSDGGVRFAADNEFVDFQIVRDAGQARFDRVEVGGVEFAPAEGGGVDFAVGAGERIRITRVESEGVAFGSVSEGVVRFTPTGPNLHFEPTLFSRLEDATGGPGPQANINENSTKPPKGVGPE